MSLVLNLISLKKTILLTEMLSINLNNQMMDWKKIGGSMSLKNLAFSMLKLKAQCQNMDLIFDILCIVTNDSK